MTRELRVQLVAVLFLVGSLAGSALVTPALTTSAGRNRLVYTDRAEEGQPPEVALGIAMGAFRGIFVNYLWIRANTLKEAGRFHEALQLSKAITTLQPRFPRVWVFHAWNMAYNISVTTQTSSERWGWVSNGINLLRSQGIPANPNDLLLHKELGWIFLHKIQGTTDDANPYYKRQLATEWTIVLGPPPAVDATFNDRALASEQYAAWLRPIAEAPDTLEALGVAMPKAAALADALRAAGFESFDFDFLRRYQIQFGVQKSLRRAAIEAMQAAKNPQRLALGKLMSDPAYADVWPAFIAHVRKRVLADKYNMEPQRMVRYTLEYGPLDWRHGASHAVYWSARGVEQSGTRWSTDNKKDFDFINSDRVTIQAVQDLARTGNLYFNFLDYVNGAGDAMFLEIPNPNFIETYGSILSKLVARSWADTDKRAYSFYSAGYENFLRDQIRFYWRRGQKDMAEKLYTTLRTYPGQNMNDPSRAEELSKPLKEWIADEIIDQQKTTYVMTGEVTASLMSSYAGGLLAGDMQAFRDNFGYARVFHSYYMDEQLRKNTVAQQGRVETLPSDFREVASSIFWVFLQMLEIDDAERVYQRAPEDLRQTAYDLIRERFKPEIDELAKTGGRTFEQIFPEPPGMDEYRSLVAHWRAEAAKRKPPEAAEK